MQWINTLLNKFAAKPVTSPTAQAAGTGEDADALRRALTDATDDNQCALLAARLGRALAERAQAPSGEDPPEVWVTAICHAADKTLALAWLASLQDDVWLGRVATQARSAEVRYAAAQRVETTAALAQTAQDSRSKDKRVYRHCADLLRQRQQAESSARRALEITDEIHALLAAAPLPLSPLLALKNELSALTEAGEAGLACQTLLQQALDRVQQESLALRDLHNSQSAAVTLAMECAHAVWPWHAQIAGWQARFDNLSVTYASLPAWLAEQAAAHALCISLNEIKTRLAALGADAENMRACEEFLAGLTPDAPLDANATAAWEALTKPGDAATHEMLQARWQALHANAPAVAICEPTPPPVAKPAAQTTTKVNPKIDHEALRDLLDKLEQAIGQGHLIDADTAAKRIKTALAGNSLHGALESRLHGLHAQLETLRGWARWGTGQAREQLIAAAGALLVSEHEVEELARDITALREEWKQLNVHGAATKGQWDIFNTTLEQAYLPVATRRAEEAAAQAAACAAKEALCDAWASELTGIAWEQANYKSIEARRAELQKQWRDAPQAGFRHERPLRKRFDALISDLDRHLDAARRAESNRREQLIAEAEALSGQTDLGRAMAQAKALQARWNQQPTPVRLKRSEEDRLWHRFRAACNVVFERRDALRSEKTTQQQERMQRQQTLLDTFAARLTNADTNAIRQALAQFRADWNASKPDKRDSADQLESRAHELEQQAQRRLDELRHEKVRARFDLLAQKAALAHRVETATLAAEPLEEIVAAAKQTWDELPQLPAKTERLLAQRFAAASRITSTELAAGSETRGALLLDLEIALGLPSPDDYAEVRRERQLAQLRNRFAAADPQPETELLLARTYATPTLPDAVFDRRIAAVVRAMTEQGSNA
jgi:hypothetical protein